MCTSFWAQQQRSLHCTFDSPKTHDKIDFLVIHRRRQVPPLYAPVRGQTDAHESTFVTASGNDIPILGKLAAQSKSWPAQTSCSIDGEGTPAPLLAR